MRLIGELITARALSAIGSEGRAVFLDLKCDGDQLLSPSMIQFRIRIGIGPVTVGTVVVKTTAAILTVTGKAYIKMGTAEILFANRTGRRRMSAANKTQTIFWQVIGREDIKRA